MNYDTTEFEDNSIMNEIKLTHKIPKIPIVEYKSMDLTKKSFIHSMSSNKNKKEDETGVCTSNSKISKLTNLKFTSDNKRHFQDLLLDINKDFSNLNSKINKELDDSSSDIPDECDPIKSGVVKSNIQNSKKNSAKQVFCFQISE